MFLSIHIHVFHTHQLLFPSARISEVGLQQANLLKLPLAAVLRRNLARKYVTICLVLKGKWFGALVSNLVLPSPPDVPT